MMLIENFNELFLCRPGIKPKRGKRKSRAAGVAGAAAKFALSVDTRSREQQQLAFSVERLLSRAPETHAPLHPANAVAASFEQLLLSPECCHLLSQISQSCAANECNPCFVSAQALQLRNLLCAAATFSQRLTVAAATQEVSSLAAQVQQHFETHFAFLQN